MQDSSFLNWLYILLEKIVLPQNPVVFFNNNVQSCKFYDLEGVMQQLQVASLKSARRLLRKFLHKAINFQSVT